MLMSLLICRSTCHQNMARCHKSQHLAKILFRRICHLVGFRVQSILLIHDEVQLTNVLVLHAEVCQGFNSLTCQNIFKLGCITYESEDEGFSDILQRLRKHCTTIGKVDDLLATADKEASQGSEDIRFAETFNPVEIDCFTLTIFALDFV